METPPLARWCSGYYSRAGLGMSTKTKALVKFSLGNTFLLKEYLLKYFRIVVKGQAQAFMQNVSLYT